jgi:hypothetical protein
MHVLIKCYLNLHDEHQLTDSTSNAMEIDASNESFDDNNKDDINATFQLDDSLVQNLMLRHGVNFTKLFHICLCKATTSKLQCLYNYLQELDIFRYVCDKVLLTNELLISH